MNIYNLVISLQWPSCTIIHCIFFLSKFKLHPWSFHGFFCSLNMYHEPLDMRLRHFRVSWLPVIQFSLVLLKVQILNWINLVHFSFILTMDHPRLVFLPSLMVQIITSGLVQCIEHLEVSWNLSLSTIPLLQSLMVLILYIVHGTGPICLCVMRNNTTCI